MIEFRRKLCVTKRDGCVPEIDIALLPILGRRTMITPITPITPKTSVLIINISLWNYAKYWITYKYWKCSFFKNWILQGSFRYLPIDRHIGRGSEKPMKRIPRWIEYSVLIIVFIILSRESLTISCLPSSEKHQLSEFVLEEDLVVRPCSTRGAMLEVTDTIQLDPS